MDRLNSLSDILRNVAPTTRREFLKRSVAMGAAVPVVGSLLAACGGDDDDDDDGGDSDGGGGEAQSGPTPTSARRSVPTPNIGGSAATEEEDDAEADATEEDSGDADATPTEEAETDDATPTEEADSGSGDGEPTTGGVFIMMGHHEIASLSPDDWGPTVHYVIVGNIHDRLLKLDPFFNLQPSMCESFEISEDALTYTFHIREGVTWHDDTPFTANDVAYTFNYYGTPENAAASASNFEGVASTEAVDDMTVVVTMESPNAAFLTRAGQAGLVQEAHHSAIGEDAYKADPIGTGPWMLKEWRAAEFTECVANPNYWSGAPLMDGIRENIVPEASVRAIALQNKEADSAVWPLVTDDHLLFLDEDGDYADYTVQTTSSVAVNHFPLNTQHPILSDVRVRKALMHALNREAIRDDLWQGLAVLATANLSPAIDFYYEPDVTQYPYDPAMAEQLLEEAGWVMGDDGIREKDGQKLTWTCVTITGDQARGPEAELAQANFRDVGIDMQLQEAPVATIQEGQRNGTVDMSLYNWTYGGDSGEPDASNTLRSDARNNWSLYQNPEMDELLDQGLVETDPEARKAIYSQIQKIVADDVPFLFVKYWDWFNIFTPRVKGLPEDVLASNTYMWLETVWLDDSES